MDALHISGIHKDIAASDFASAAWDAAHRVTVAHYWSGEAAPETRRFDARLLWSDIWLYVRFDAAQYEPLVLSGGGDLLNKTDGLWETDVCEIFIAPDPAFPARYFEFEVAPTGEWLDLGIEIVGERRVTDRDYRSGVETAARIDDHSVIEVMKIPFRSLERTPAVGDIWKGNLFRCVGAGPTRGYLAWRPTRTPVPSFHVPDAFGDLRFIDR